MAGGGQDDRAKAPSMRWGEKRIVALHAGGAGAAGGKEIEFANGNLAILGRGKIAGEIIVGVKRHE